MLSIYERRFKYLCFCTLFLLLFLLVSKPAHSKELLRIGVLFDGPTATRQVFLDKLNHEIERLLGSKYEVQIPAENILTGKWSVDGIRKNYRRLIADPDVRIIVGAGVLTAAVFSEITHFTKPVIAVGAVESPIRDSESGKPGTSGIHNFTYIHLSRLVEQDLDELYAFIPYKRVGIVGTDELLKRISSGLHPLHRVLDKYNADYLPLSAAGNLDEFFDRASTLDVVYIANLGVLESDKVNLIRKLSHKNIPTFGASSGDIALGVLATVAPEENFQKIVRRTALNIEAIVSGEDPANLPVYVDFKKSLSINMQTARAIGFSPKFSFLAEARLVNEYVKQDGMRLDLKGAVRKALQKNLSLKIEQGGVSSAEEELALVRTNYFPSLSVNVSGSQIDENQAESSMGRQAERTFSGSVRVEQLLFSDEINGRVEVEGHLFSASKHAYDKQELDVILDTAIAYLDVLKAKDLRKIQKENVSLTRNNLAVAKQRELAGYSGSSDVYRWESQLASVSTQLLVAENSFKLTKIKLNHVLDHPLDDEMVLSEVSLENGLFESYLNDHLRAHINTPDSLKKFSNFLVLEANRYSPEIRVLDENISALERRLKIYKRKRALPVVSASAESQHVLDQRGMGADVLGTGVNKDAWAVGLNLSWRPFQGGKIGAAVRKTQTEIYILKDKRALLNKTVEMGVRAAVLDLLNNMVNLRASEKSAYFAQRGLDMVEDAYARGTVSIVDVAAAQSDSISASQAALSSVYEYLLSMMKLEHAVGKFTLFNTAEEQNSYFNRVDEYLSRGMDET